MIRSMDEFASAFHAARCVSTPLVPVRTANPASTTHFVIEILKQGRELPPLLGWDVMRGLYAVSRDSSDELGRVLGDREAATVGPAHALSLAHQLRDEGLLLYANGHRFWNEPGVMQGIWNVRDPFKATGRMLVLLTVPGATLPPELGQDVLERTKSGDICCSGSPRRLSIVATSAGEDTGATTMRNIAKCVCIRLAAPAGLYRPGMGVRKGHR